MKFTVVCAGAMGLRFGVLLQEAGNEVDFVEGWCHGWGGNHHGNGIEKDSRHGRIGS